MINIDEITIEEFEDKIYDKYTLLFPEEEQRDWDKIETSYKNGIEKFYKITLDNTIIGFFTLEKLENYPYYCDYYAIYDEYQNKGYGSLAFKKLLDEIVKEDGLIGEIEKIEEDNPITQRRFKFYEELGFKKYDSEYLLYGVLYIPLTYKYECHKDKIDTILFKYYEMNVGTEELKKNCKIIK